MGSSSDICLFADTKRLLLQVMSPLVGCAAASKSSAEEPLWAVLNQSGAFSPPTVVVTLSQILELNAVSREAVVAFTCRFDSDALHVIYHSNTSGPGVKKNRRSGQLLERPVVVR